MYDSAFLRLWDRLSRSVFVKNWTEKNVFVSMVTTGYPINFDPSLKEMCPTFQKKQTTCMIIAQQEGGSPSNDIASANCCRHCCSTGLLEGVLSWRSIMDATWSTSSSTSVRWVIIYQDTKSGWLIFWPSWTRHKFDCKNNHPVGNLTVKIITPSEIWL